MNKGFMMRKTPAVSLVILTGAIGTDAVGGVIEFTDKDEWIAAVGEFTTIGFTEFPNDTFITDQYADLGVLFTDGNDNITCCSDITFPIDGSGLDGNAAIHLSFNEPQRWIAADFPGGLRFELYLEGQLVYESGNFAGSGYGFFAGLLSSQPFDAAIISDFVDEQVGLDDLHFGIPAPGALAVLLLGGLLVRQPRSRSGRPTRRPPGLLHPHRTSGSDLVTPRAQGAARLAAQLAAQHVAD